MRSKFKLNLDTGQTGLDMFFKPYQRMALEILWDHPEGLSTREVWSIIKDEKGHVISRASVINFLADAAEHELLEFREETGKGGYRRYYWHKYDKPGLSGHLTELVEKALNTL